MIVALKAATASTNTRTAGTRTTDKSDASSSSFQDSLHVQSLSPETVQTSHPHPDATDAKADSKAKAGAHQNEDATSSIPLAITVLPVVNPPVVLAANPSPDIPTTINSTGGTRDSNPDIQASDIAVDPTSQRQKPAAKDIDAGVANLPSFSALPDTANPSLQPVPSTDTSPTPDSLSTNDDLALHATSKSGGDLRVAKPQETDEAASQDPLLSAISSALTLASSQAKPLNTEQRPPLGSDARTHSTKFAISSSPSGIAPRSSASTGVSVANAKKSIANAKSALRPADEASASSTKEDASNFSQQSSDQPDSTATVASLAELPPIHVADTAADIQAALPQGVVVPASTSKPAGTDVTPTLPSVAISAPHVPSPTDPSMALNNVRLLQSAGRSEMTIGMHSTEFGSISIRTTNLKDQIAAEVSVDHAELSKALLSHLPELRSSGERPLDLRVTTMTLTSDTFPQGRSSGGYTEGGSQRSPRQQEPPSPSSLHPATSPVAMTATPQIYESGARLDVRA